jgi:hypothetical protein
VYYTSTPTDTFLIYRNNDFKSIYADTAIVHKKWSVLRDTKLIRGDRVTWTEESEPELAMLGHEALRAGQRAAGGDGVPGSRRKNSSQQKREGEEEQKSGRRSGRSSDVSRHGCWPLQGSLQARNGDTEQELDKVRGNE